MKQLVAINRMSGMKIIERYVEGVRYLKVTPSNLLPLIMENLKKQLAGKPVRFEQSKTGWIKIVKEDNDEDMEKAGAKLISAEDKINKRHLDETYVLNKEAEMLKGAGFEVKVEEIGE